MKREILLIAIFICFSFLSCKKELPDQALLVRDCTGAYLRMNKTNYKVCNLQKVAAFENVTTVFVSLKKIKECNGDGNPHINVICYINLIAG